MCIHNIISHFGVSTILTHCPRLPPEQQDVHNFLLDNMANGGILDLMMRYLKAVGQKFMEEWPRGLTAVVLEVYQTWRKHSNGLPNPLLRDCSNQHIRVNESWLILWLLDCLLSYWDVYGLTLIYFKPFKAFL